MLRLKILTAAAAIAALIVPSAIAAASPTTPNEVHRVTNSTPLKLQHRLIKREAIARSDSSVPPSLAWDGRYEFVDRVFGTSRLKTLCFLALNLTGADVLVRGDYTVRPGAELLYCPS